MNRERVLIALRDNVIIPWLDGIASELPADEGHHGVSVVSWYDAVLLAVTNTPLSPEIDQTCLDNRDMIEGEYRVLVWFESSLRDGLGLLAHYLPSEVATFARYYVDLDKIREFILSGPTDDAVARLLLGVCYEITSILDRYSLESAALSTMSLLHSSSILSVLSSQLAVWLSTGHYLRLKSAYPMGRL